MAINQNIRTYSRFGGLRQDIAEANSGPDNALIAKNCRFLVSDEVRHRDGFGFFNNTQPVDDPISLTNILGIHQFKHGGESDLLVACGGNLYVEDGTTSHDSLTTLSTSLDDSSYYSFCTLNSQCYIVNNADTNMKYDGTDLTNMSIEAPDISGMSTNLINTSGNLANGVYYYVITYSNSVTGQESNPNSMDDSSTSNLRLDVFGGPYQCRLEDIPYNTDPQVNKVNIYRTSVNGSIYDAQFVTSVANTETVAGSGVIDEIIDNTADSDLLDPIQLFHSSAPIFKKVIVHKNKVFGFEENSTILHYSYDFNGWYFPRGEFGGLDFRVEINRDDGDYIKNIVSYINGLIIFKENSTWILEGYDENDFFLRRIDYNENIGCVGHRGAVTVNNYVYFIDKKGIYVTDGNGFSNISQPVQSFLNNKNLIFGEAIDRTEVNNACIGVDTYNNNKVIKFSFTPISGDYNTVTLVYDYELKKWSLDDGYAAQSYAKYEEDNVEFLLRGDDKGYVFKESVNNYDGDYLFLDGNNPNTGGVGYVITSTINSNKVTILKDGSLDANQYKNNYLIFLSGDLKGQKYRIASNEGTISIENFTLIDADLPLTNNIYKAVIGSCEMTYVSGWDNYGNPGYSKRLKYVRPRIKTNGSANVDLYNLFDFSLLLNEVREISITPSLVYGSDDLIWDDPDGLYWGNVKIEYELKRTQPNKVHTYHAYGIRSYDIAAEIVLNNYDKIYQVKGLGIRWKLIHLISVVYKTAKECLLI